MAGVLAVFARKITKDLVHNYLRYFTRNPGFSFKNGPASSKKTVAVNVKFDLIDLTAVSQQSYDIHSVRSDCKSLE